MEISSTAFILLIILVVGILFVASGCALSCSSRSGFTFNNSEYQYSNPNLSREDFYYKCLVDECGGDTDDYYCLQKCHLKSYRLGMEAGDVKDLVCHPYANDEDAFYRCLADTYSNYKYP